MKFDSFKLRWTLLPLIALKEVVKVLTAGACKYADDNWQKVEDAKLRYKDASFRHLTAYLEGEVEDSDYGLHHLAHLICDAFFLIWFDIMEGIYKPFTPNFKSIKEKYDKVKKEKDL